MVIRKGVQFRAGNPHIPDGILSLSFATSAGRFSTSILRRRVVQDHVGYPV